MFASAVQSLRSVLGHSLRQRTVASFATVPRRGISRVPLRARFGQGAGVSPLRPSYLLTPKRMTVLAHSPRTDAEPMVEQVAQLLSSLGRQQLRFDAASERQEAAVVLTRKSGMVASSTPLAERAPTSACRLYVELQVARGDEDGLEIGVGTRPAGEAHLPHGDRLQDLTREQTAHAWYVDSAGNFVVDSRLRMPSGFQPAKHCSGAGTDRVALAVLRDGTFVLAVNGVVKCRMPGSVTNIPAEQPLYLLVNVRGERSSVRVLPDAQLGTELAKKLEWF